MQCVQLPKSMTVNYKLGKNNPLTDALSAVLKICNKMYLCNRYVEVFFFLSLSHFVVTSSYYPTFRKDIRSFENFGFCEERGGSK